MHIYIQGYYGYKNRGDELLLWGILDYIQQTISPITHITLSCGDEIWTKKRLIDNKIYIGNLGLSINIDKVDISYITTKKRNTTIYDVYIFGGGEVFAESRGLHGGRNYALRYWNIWGRKPIYLLGGIETPHTRWQKLLYTYTLPKATSITCREQTSYLCAKQYNSNTMLFHDFAETILDKYRQSRHKDDSYMTGKKPYIVVNCIKKMDTDQSHIYIRKFVALYPDHDIYYMPCGTDDHGISDTSIYTTIQAYIPQIQLYDWTSHTLQETLNLFAHASGGIGARLHFLLPLHCFGIRLYALTYAEKITKLITSSISL